MQNQSGCGEKTSALFAKTIFYLHNNEYPDELKIWNDAPTDLEKDDIYLLPVDAVIIAIFKHLENKKWDFKRVNREMGWNLNKYWILRESDISPKMMNEIKKKAMEFLTILNEESTSYNKKLN